MPKRPTHTSSHSQLVTEPCASHVGSFELHLSVLCSARSQNVENKDSRFVKHVTVSAPNALRGRCINLRNRERTTDDFFYLFLRFAILQRMLATRYKRRPKRSCSLSVNRADSREWKLIRLKQPFTIQRPALFPPLTATISLVLATYFAPLSIGSSTYSASYIPISRTTFITAILSDTIP